MKEKSLEEGSDDHQDGGGNAGNGLQGTSSARVGGARRVGTSGRGESSDGDGGGRGRNVGDSNVQGTLGPGLDERGLAGIVVGDDELGPVLNKLGGVEGGDRGHLGLGEVVNSRGHGKLGAGSAELSGIDVAGVEEGSLVGADGTRGQVDGQLGDKAARGVGGVLSQAVLGRSDLGGGEGDGLGVERTVGGADGGGKEDIKGSLSELEDVAVLGLNGERSIAGSEVLCLGTLEGAGRAGGLGADALDQGLVVRGGTSIDESVVVDLVGEALLVGTGRGRSVVAEDSSAVGVLSVGERGDRQEDGSSGSNCVAHCCCYVYVNMEGREVERRMRTEGKRRKEREETRRKERKEEKRN